jgi:hypothetical protein
MNTPRVWHAWPRKSFSQDTVHRFPNAATPATLVLLENRKTISPMWHTCVCFKFDDLQQQLIVYNPPPALVWFHRNSVHTRTVFFDRSDLNRKEKSGGIVWILTHARPHKARQIERSVSRFDFLLVRNDRFVQTLTSKFDKFRHLPWLASWWSHLDLMPSRCTTCILMRVPAPYVIINSWSARPA